MNSESQLAFLSVLFGLIFMLGGLYLSPKIENVYYRGTAISSDDPVSRFICKNLSKLTKRDQCLFLGEPQATSPADD